VSNLRLLVVGVVSVKGLGDALHYSIASFLLSREMPNAEITLALPELSSAKFCILDWVKVLPGLEKQSVAHRLGVI
jgi:ADP-heptose:LPS heptosyltransferase